MDGELGWLALSLAPGIGDRTFHRLLRRFGSPDRVFTCRRSELGEIPGLKKLIHTWNIGNNPALEIYS